jgi:CheY-like chemotaxis protein
VARRILIVDDDADSVEVLGGLLTDAGYDVAAAPDGVAALVALYWSPRPDLILLDLWMPIVPGGDVLDQLRGDPILSTIPVVVLTAAPVPSPIRCAATAVLQKPFDLSGFLSLIEQLANGGAGEGAQKLPPGTWN